MHSEHVYVLCIPHQLPSCIHPPLRGGHAVTPAPSSGTTSADSYSAHSISGQPFHTHPCTDKQELEVCRMMKVVGKSVLERLFYKLCKDDLPLPCRRLHCDPAAALVTAGLVDDGYHRSLIKRQRSPETSISVFCLDRYVCISAALHWSIRFTFTITEVAVALMCCGRGRTSFSW